MDKPQAQKLREQLWVENPELFHDPHEAFIQRELHRMGVPPREYEDETPVPERCMYCCGVELEWRPGYPGEEFLVCTTCGKMLLANCDTESAIRAVI